MKRTKAFTLIELLVVVAIISLLVMILMPSLTRARELARRAVCAANLNGIGKGFTIYAGDYSDKPPWITRVVAGVDTAVIAWNTATGTQAQQAAAPTSLSSTALLFLLVRTGQPVKLFICPSDTVGNPMESAKWDNAGTMTFYWDFIDATRSSYSVQAPLTNNRPGYTGQSQGGLAIVADKNPEYDTAGSAATNWADGDLTDQAIQGGMSRNHRGESGGEYINVLYADTHVGHGPRADVGVNRDNIYTASNTAPTAQLGAFNGAQHLSADDSFLVGPMPAAAAE
jgi:prepilin-type N-terminal cleavage/methylation domain-containing protein/prepilin-type processing-associated H-X9-DG protein